MAQVKFYATTAESYAAIGTKDTGGIYFVEGGELYKGTSRFGANKVFTKGENQDLASFASVGQIGGDILVGIGAAKVWDPATGANGSWVDLGADNTALQSLWRSDISTWTAGLVQSGEGSYITGITQGEDGKVTASASNFATDVKTAIGNGTASSSANGISVEVTTTSGSVTSVSVAAANISATSVTADSGTFTNLTVSDTATFNATTVSASTLTVGGVAVSNIAATSASDADNGVAVTVSTANGGVTGVDVAVTGNLATFAGKSVVTTIGPSSGEGAASDSNIPTEAAVRAALNNFDNAMHFRGVEASTGAISDPAAGDIVVIGSEPATGFVTGQEYVYTTASTWELIGDQNTYAAAATVTALASRVSDIEGIVSASTSTVSANSGVFASSLTIGGSTVEQLADQQIAAIAEASASDVDKGVTVSVVTQSGSVKSVDVAVVASATMSFNDAGSSDVLATTAAVKSFYDNNLVWLDASGVAIA